MLKEIQRTLSSNQRILAVSKLQPLQKIELLHKEGQIHFGENYIQEALEKQSQLSDLPEIEWHFIGHIQKNKLKNIIGKFFELEYTIMHVLLTGCFLPAPPFMAVVGVRGCCRKTKS